MALRITVWVDSGAGTVSEGRAFAAELSSMLNDTHTVATLDRLSSRTATYAAMIKWAVVEPRVVTVEEDSGRVGGGRLVARSVGYDAEYLRRIVRDFEKGVLATRERASRPRTSVPPASTADAKREARSGAGGGDAEDSCR